MVVETVSRREEKRPEHGNRERNDKDLLQRDNSRNELDKSSDDIKQEFEFNKGNGNTQLVGLSAKIRKVE